MAKRYEELTISDDFIFGKTMGDKVLCHDEMCIRDSEKTVRFQCGILQYYRSTYSDHCIMYRRNREEREPG